MGKMDKLLRLVLCSEDAFWVLVDQEGMTAELRPAKPAAQIVFARNRSSNVIVANFGNGGFRLKCLVRLESSFHQDSLRQFSALFGQFAQQHQRIHPFVGREHGQGLGKGVGRERHM